MTDGFAPTEADERIYSSVPLGTDEGERVVRQQAVGADQVEGGGQLPAEPRPPQQPAPGRARAEPHTDVEAAEASPFQQPAPGASEAEPGAVREGRRSNRCAG